MGISLALLGCGAFGSSFIRHWRAHPDVARFALCDHDSARLAAAAREHDVTETYDSLEALVASDIEAVALFSQHWMHAPQAVALLDAGKHVYSAVPAAASLDECDALVRAVERSGRLYMMGETSLFRAECAYCCQRAAAGDFGHLVHFDAEYLHDLDHGLRDVLRNRLGEAFSMSRTGAPPMHYPTHSIGFVMAICAAVDPDVHVTSVSALGTAIPGDDWHRADTDWHNPYGNEIALLELSCGATARIAEMRKVGHPGAERVARVYGTEGTFELGSRGASWCTKSGCEPVEPTLDFAPLPAALAADRGGHGGSHAHLVHEFVSAVRDGRQPRMNVWQAVRTLAPGLVAHESTVQQGRRLPVPDWGSGPGSA
ncbi:MAG: Gfo/Idh/MocA family oxidoreductase [Armatimonadetes bacterium]|nr:Gfo/Idh/MocA family oxidoreductase [Armatimonadota bacterium]